MAPQILSSVNNCRHHLARLNDSRSRSLTIAQFSSTDTFVFDPALPSESVCNDKHSRQHKSKGFANIFELLAELDRSPQTIRSHAPQGNSEKYCDFVTNSKMGKVGIETNTLHNGVLQSFRKSQQGDRIVLGKWIFSSVLNQQLDVSLNTGQVRNLM